MNVSIVTVLPELYDPLLKTSLLKRAQEQGLVHYSVSSFREYARPKERIDAPPFGPGAGMLIKPEIVERAVDDKERTHGKAYKIFFSPQGEPLTQKVAQRIATQAQRCGHLLLVAGRYEGMDARVEERYADEIISLGDFVVMGGDVPAMLLLEAVLRLVPGVVGKQESVEHESFTGPFIDYPQYTEPLEWHEMKVPDIIRSGNHAAIQAWRMQEAAVQTVRNHFQWLRSSGMTQREKKLAYQAIPPHYIVLMHSEVLVGKERQVGTTSVTSIDIHDIARSSATYGMRAFFIVTPLFDQQKIVQTLLDFWQEGEGVTYNQSRHSALKQVILTATLDQAIETIQAEHGKKPLLVATSARKVDDVTSVSYFDQEVVWSHDRPVLLVFGTGQGLSPECLQRCDYVLPPVVGFTEFNHLSVRSAVAIVVDRWLGINEKSA